jgi:NADH oxidase (H2O-forming)
MQLKRFKRHRKTEVFIPYVSAYHNTGKMAEMIAEGIKSSGDFDVEVADIETMSLGDLDEKMAKSKAVIVGCPTINQNILLACVPAICCN